MLYIKKKQKMLIYTVLCLVLLICSCGKLEKLSLLDNPTEKDIEITTPLTIKTQPSENVKCTDNTTDVILAPATAGTEYIMPNNSENVTDNGKYYQDVIFPEGLEIPKRLLIYNTIQIVEHDYFIDIFIKNIIGENNLDQYESDDNMRFMSDINSERRIYFNIKTGYFNYRNYSQNDLTAASNNIDTLTSEEIDKKVENIILQIEKIHGELELIESYPMETICRQNGVCNIMEVYYYIYEPKQKSDILASYSPGIYDKQCVRITMYRNGVIENLVSTIIKTELIPWYCGDIAPSSDSWINQQKTDDISWFTKDILKQYLRTHLELMSDSPNPVIFIDSIEVIPILYAEMYPTPQVQDTLRVYFHVSDMETGPLYLDFSLTTIHNYYESGTYISDAQKLAS